jgi:hypothetical protein
VKLEVKINRFSEKIGQHAQGQGAKDVQIHCDQFFRERRVAAEIFRLEITWKHDG